MKLTSTEHRLLEILQVGHSRQELVAKTGGHPIYLARLLKSMTDRGLLEATYRPPVQSRMEYRAKVRVDLVPISTAPETAGAQDAG
jgi:hypothetical protein